jgi:predicted enzyme related to lactoylglutathione lyase
MPCAATIFAKSLDQLASFYTACFGLEEVAGAPGDYQVLESESWTLSIVQVPSDVAAAIQLSVPPTRREATPIKLTFDVLSIAAVRETVADFGGRADDLEWEFRGFRHCDFVDPEGNVSQLREPVTIES